MYLGIKYKIYVDCIGLGGDIYLWIQLVQGQNPALAFVGSQYNIRTINSLESSYISTDSQRIYQWESMLRWTTLANQEWEYLNSQLKSTFISTQIFQSVVSLWWQNAIKTVFVTISLYLYSLIVPIYRQTYVINAYML